MVCSRNIYLPRCFDRLLVSHSKLVGIDAVRHILLVWDTVGAILKLGSTLDAEAGFFIEVFVTDELSTPVTGVSHILRGTDFTRTRNTHAR